MTLSRGVPATEDRAIDTLLCHVSERVTVPGFQILVRERRVGKGNPSPRKFAAFLNNWFSSFNHATERAMLASTGGFDEMPATVYEEAESGWRIEMVLYPVEDAGQMSVHVAASPGTTAGWCKAKDRLRDNIREKTGQHRECDGPLILAIALNDFANEPDLEDVVDVLVGTSHWTVTSSHDDPPARGRDADGIWSPNNQRASARPAGLLLVRGVYPWSLTKAQPELWNNPLAGREKWLPAWRYRRLHWDVPGNRELRDLPGEATTL